MEPSVKFCGRCGARIIPNTNFCPFCGYALNNIDRTKLEDIRIEIALDRIRSKKREAEYYFIFAGITDLFVAFIPSILPWWAIVLFCLLNPLNYVGAWLELKAREMEENLKKGIIPE